METVNTVFAVIAGVFGAGWGLQFLYYRYEKRKRGAESKIAELDADAKEDEMRNTKLIQAYETVVKLQSVVDTERRRWIAISVELSELKFELLQEKEARRFAEHDKCTVKECENRCPPRHQKSENA